MANDDGQIDLIERARTGDHPALERLLLEHYDRLAARISRKLPAFLRGTVSAEDILQQTFVDVFRGIRAYQPAGERAFYRWLATIADHRLQDVIRAQLAAKRGGGRAGGGVGSWLDSTDELIDLLAGPEHTPSQSVARHEAAAAVQVSLASLKDDYRRVIELRYIKALPIAEVAREMEKTEPAVHGLCRRALEELRLILGQSSQYFSHH
ncbi:MAG: sigma-70 family RNA polymerase sigma factor [Chloroflexi bacterium]|nr:sigma-70 family RNA polymerase sigma factor [Chloroflexota bacterium]